jgi:hypothetical protein
MLRWTLYEGELEEALCNQWTGPLDHWTELLTDP